jgi:hypothetical protein
VKWVIGSLTVSAWGGVIGHTLACVIWFTQAIWPRYWAEELSRVPDASILDPKWIFVYVPAACVLIGTYIVGRLLRQWWYIYRHRFLIQAVQFSLVDTIFSPFVNFFLVISGIFCLYVLLTGDMRSYVGAFITLILYWVPCLSIDFVISIWDRDDIKGETRVIGS